jgi:uncharacterized protein YjgD (DUF1641 family)
VAQPIALEFAPRDRAAELRSDLENASTQHTEALLAAYEVLQDLHEQGLLEILRGAISAKDEILEKVVTAVNTPETIRAIRSLLYLGGTLGRIEPDWFKGIFQAIPEGLAKATAERNRPVGFWRLLRRTFSKDSLRAVAAAVDLLEAFGRHLRSLEDVRSKAGSQLQIGKEL